MHEHDEVPQYPIKAMPDARPMGGLQILAGIACFLALIAWMQHRDGEEGIADQLKHVAPIDCDSALPRERIIELTASYRGEVLLKQCVYIKAPIGEPRVRM